jgi:hypothetical protein
MKTSFKIALIAVSVLVLAGILIGLHMYNLKSRDLQKVKPDFTVTAIDLQKAFEDNESASNSKYVNKVIEVTGIIESIKPGDNKTLNISLKTGSPLSSVNCTFQTVPDTSKLRASGQIKLRGECSGYLMDVLLNNCSVIQK